MGCGKGEFRRFLPKFETQRAENGAWEPGEGVDIGESQGFRRLSRPRSRFLSLGNYSTYDKCDAGDDGPALAVRSREWYCQD